MKKTVQSLIEGFSNSNKQKKKAGLGEFFREDDNQLKQGIIILS